MTNKGRRDKESCAGCHRKRTKPLVRRSTLGYGDVSTSSTRVAKHVKNRGLRLSLRCFLPRDWFMFSCFGVALPMYRGSLTVRPSVSS